MRDGANVTVAMDKLLLPNYYYYIFVVIGSRVGEDAQQEISFLVNDSVIGTNGNYHDLTSAFNAIVDASSSITFKGYSNNGSFEGFTSRAICIPFRKK